MSHEDLDVLEASIEQRPTKRTRYQTERIPILVFADNFWLLATSIRQLRSMCDKFMELLGKAGFGVDLAECCWSSTSKSNDAAALAMKNRWPELLSQPSRADTVTITRIARTDSFKALGCQISCSGDCTAEVQYRLARAWAVFAKHSSLVRSRGGSVLHRLCFLRRVLLLASSV